MPSAPLCHLLFGGLFPLFVLCKVAVNAVQASVSVVARQSVSFYNKTGPNSRLLTSRRRNTLLHLPQASS